MGIIRQLPAAVVNQIAAGEVVERPASVVKELLENAIDAGARRIEVHLQKGGQELVRVVDDGCGIAPDDLPLALAPHATSKLRSAEDLAHISTMGFRGEALASIASVARVRIESRQRESENGYAIECAGGEMSAVTACGCPVGTMVQVRDLFFNVPVRRKFLKTPQTELGHAVEAFTRVALAYPELQLTLSHNRRIVYELPATGQLLERLGMFFGRELVEQLIWVEQELDGYRLWGYVANPSQTRPNTRGQYFFVNRRYVRDRVLSHALAEAYRGLLMTGRHPIAFLFLDVPHDQVDVNVHPTKIEVRFRDSQRIYSLVLGTLRDRFLKTDLTAPLRTEPPEQHDAFALPEEPAAQSSPPSAAVPGRTVDSEQHARADAVLRSLDGFYARQTGHSRPQRATADEFSLRRSPPPPRKLPLQPARGQDTQRGGDRQPDVPRAIQVHDAYLVVETEDGLMVIDQHALHERILYDELRRRVEEGTLQSQRLLVPEPVPLTAEHEALVEEHSDLLRELGLELELFGNRSALLRAYPAMLANVDPVALVHDILSQLAECAQRVHRRELLDRMLHTIACKAAVKAGQRLSDEEIRALLARRELARDHHHCPHGRPTALVLTRDELDRRFGRR